MKLQLNSDTVNTYRSRWETAREETNEQLQSLNLPLTALTGKVHAPVTFTPLQLTPAALSLCSSRCVTGSLYETHTHSYVACSIQQRLILQNQ